MYGNPWIWLQPQPKQPKQTPRALLPPPICQGTSRPFAATCRSWIRRQRVASTKNTYKTTRKKKHQENKKSQNTTLGIIWNYTNSEPTNVSFSCEGVHHLIQKYLPSIVGTWESSQHKTSMVFCWGMMDARWFNSWPFYPQSLGWRSPFQQPLKWSPNDPPTKRRCKAHSPFLPRFEGSLGGKRWTYGVLSL